MSESSSKGSEETLSMHASPHRHVLVDRGDDFNLHRSGSQDRYHLALGLSLVKA